MNCKSTWKIGVGESKATELVAFPASGVDVYSSRAFFLFIFRGSGSAPSEPASVTDSAHAIPARYRSEEAGCSGRSRCVAAVPPFRSRPGATVGSKIKKREIRTPFPPLLVAERRRPGTTCRAPWYRLGKTMTVGVVSNPEEVEWRKEIQALPCLSSSISW